MSDTSEPARFPGSQGVELDARLELPKGRAAAFALFAHCFTCDKTSAAASRISRALAEHEIATLLTSEVRISTRLADEDA